MSSSGLWVFGYGSLLWKPGFNYSQSLVGSIKGFKRRFWQGNDVHRGTSEKLGRVVTLIAEKEAITWGRAYRMEDEDECRKYLDQREGQEGGYETVMVEFTPRDTNKEPFQVLVYIATSSNRFFLGPAPSMTIARDIASAQGECGHNVEYLAKLVAFMRYHCPDIWDDHLYELESLVTSILRKKKSELLYHFEDALNQEALRLLKSLEGLRILDFDFDWRIEQEIKSLESRLKFRDHLVPSSKGVRVNI